MLNGALPVPRIFKHELLQSFSFHLFAKRPIEPIVTFDALRRDVMRRMALSALQIRFNVQQRQDPLFTFVDFNQLNWPREGCAVCSLDLTADPSCWRPAVQLAVREIRRLGLFGLTENELVRYKQAVLSEAEQSVAQAEQLGSEEVLTQLMEAESCGHAYMAPESRLDCTRAALDSIDVDDINAVARELCEHLSHIEPTDGVRPAAVVACAPVLSRDGSSFDVSDAEIAAAIQEALMEPLEPLADTAVPTTLIPPEALAAKMEVFPPKWVPVTGKGAVEGNGKNSLGIIQRKLSNGLRVNLMSLSAEPQRACVRLYVPGGRILEKSGQEGSVLIGSRTIQEGGAFLDKTREEVELFCIDHMVMVDIVTAEDSLVFDFQTVTTTGPGGEVTGLEACLQVAHIIMTDFKYEEDAFARAIQGFHEQYDSVVKGLETACQEKLTWSLGGGDLRLVTPDHNQLDGLTLPVAQAAITSQLGADAVEVSISGDVPMPMLEDLCLKYLGTVPPRSEAQGGKRKLESQSIEVKRPANGDPLSVFLADSDERAMGYVAGASPNRWGIFSDGSTVGDKLRALNGGKSDARRDHPLFGHVAMQILQDVSFLFSPCSFGYTFSLPPHSSFPISPQPGCQSAPIFCSARGATPHL